MINVLSFTDLVFEACMKQSINNELMFDFFFPLFWYHLLLPFESQFQGELTMFPPP